MASNKFVCTCEKNALEVASSALNVFALTCLVIGVSNERGYFTGEECRNFFIKKILLMHPIIIFNLFSK